MLTRRQYRLLFRLAQQCRNYSLTNRCLKEVKFSESGAYHGMDKLKRSRAADLNEPLYIPNKYDSRSFQNKRRLYAVLSLFALLFYFGILRETNDLDLILEAPPHVLTAGIQKKAIQEQIHKARVTGQSTELLQAELDYVDIKESSLKAEYEKQKQKQQQQ